MPGKRRMPPLNDYHRIYQYVFGLPNIVEMDPSWNSYEDVEAWLFEQYRGEGELAHKVIMGYPFDWQSNGVASIYRTHGKDAKTFLCLKDKKSTKVEITCEKLGLSPSRYDLKSLVLSQNWSKGHAAITLKGSFSEWLASSFFEEAHPVPFSSGGPNSPKRFRVNRKREATLTIFSRKGAYSESLVSPEGPDAELARV